MKKRIITLLLAFSTTALLPIHVTYSQNVTETKQATENVDKEKFFLLSAKIAKCIDAQNYYTTQALSYDGYQKRVKAIIGGDYKYMKSSIGWSVRIPKELMSKIKKIIADKTIDIPQIDPLVSSLEKDLQEIIPLWTELEEYMQTKAFEDDNGAKGKSLMKDFSPKFSKFIDDYTKFVSETDNIHQKLGKERLSLLRQEGKLLEVYTDEALKLAEDILTTFNSGSDFKNKAKLDKANALLQQLEEKNKLIQQEYDKKIAEEKKPSYKYETLHSALNRFIGNYRDARKQPSTYYSFMVRSYNDAIDAYNSIK